MKLSIYTTVTNPDERQDPWREALANYCALADEVIVVNGGKPLSYPDKKVKFIDYPWPEEWEWEEITKHMNRGLEECTGDWALRMDIDNLLHEDSFGEIRAALISPVWEDVQVVSFLAYNVTTVDRANAKGNRPLCINKRKYPQIRQGEIEGEFSDLCYPIIPKGKRPSGVYYGEKAKYQNSGVHYLNYDNTFRTKEVAKKCWRKYLKAYGKFTGKYVGLNHEDGFKVFIDMMKGRREKAFVNLNLQNHPESIRKRVESIRPDQFGYNMWGNI